MCLKTLVSQWNPINMLSLKPNPNNLIGSANVLARKKYHYSAITTAYLQWGRTTPTHYSYCLPDTIGNKETRHKTNASSPKVFRAIITRTYCKNKSTFNIDSDVSKCSNVSRPRASYHQRFYDVFFSSLYTLVTITSFAWRHEPIG